MSMYNRIVSIFGILFTCGLLLAVYWAGLHGGFFFDDQSNILEVPALRISDLSLESIIGVLQSGKSGPLGRAISQLSFAINYYFGEFNPFGYKLVNLLIHYINGLLLVILLRTLVRSVEPKASLSDTLLVSILVASVWIFHPLQMTSVLYVVQRMTSLSALFLISALVLHIRAREGEGGWWQLLVAWCLLWPMSLLSKESGILFPCFVAAWELIVRRAHKGRIDRFGTGLGWVVGVGLSAAIVYLFSSAGQWLLSGYAQRPFSLDERLLTEGRVIWQYLGLTIFPQMETLGLHHDDLTISKGLFQPWTTVVSLMGIVALAVVGLWTRKRLPLISFGIFWFLIGHSLESSFIPLEIMHEHRNYLPMIGPLLVAGWFLLRMVASGGQKKWWALCLACAFIGYLLLITSLRSHQFGDEVRRTQIETQHHRGSARSQYEAGRMLTALPDAKQADSIIHSIAKAHFERSTEVDANFKLGLLGLITLECMVTKSTSPDWVSELKKRLAMTPYAPGDNSVLFSIKEMALAKSLCLKREEVEGLFLASVSNPTASIASKQLALSWLADYLWLVERDLAAAKGALMESLVVAPWHPSSRLKLAQVEILESKLDDAAKRLRELRGAPLSVEEARLRKELMAGLGLVSDD